MEPFERYGQLEIKQLKHGGSEQGEQLFLLSHAPAALSGGAPPPSPMPIRGLFSLAQVPAKCELDFPRRKPLRGWI